MLDGGDGFFDNLLARYEFGIVQLKQVHVIRLQTLQGLIDAFQNPIVGKIKIAQPIAPAFGGQVDFLSLAL